MSASEIIKELNNRTAFKYNRRLSPAENYFTFQQCISFSNGVEFLSSSNDKPGPIFYLLAVPGLSIDLRKANGQLEKFSKELISHLSDVMTKENDLFKLFSCFYDLCKAVETLQKEYHFGRGKYFGNVTIFEYPIKELKKLQLPILRSNYRGTFLNALLPSERYSVDYNTLGVEIKKHLSSLYMLRRRYNMKLLTELNEMKIIFFKRKFIGNYYRYTGEPSHLFEVAIALLETEKIQNLNKEVFTPDDFIRDLFTFLGVHFSKRSNYRPTVESKVREGRFFGKEIPRLIRQYLDRT